MNQIRIDLHALWQYIPIALVVPPPLTLYWFIPGAVSLCPRPDGRRNKVYIPGDSGLPLRPQKMEERTYACRHHHREEREENSGVKRLTRPHFLLIPDSFRRKARSGQRVSLIIIIWWEAHVELKLFFQCIKDT